MNKRLFLIFLASVSLFTGCKLGNEARRQYDNLVNLYEETKEGRGKPPFEINYQETSHLSTIISSKCTHNQIPKHIYFATQSDAQHNIFTSIKNLYSYPNGGSLKSYWDIRYTNPVSQYINNNDGSHFSKHSLYTGLDTRQGIRNITTGTYASQTDASASIVQSKCIDGQIAAGSILNLRDAPEQTLTYGGISSTFIYQIHTDNHIRPWNTNKQGNLVLQAYFDEPIYINFEKNIGGSVSFNIFLYNPKIKKHLNYVIGLYAAGVAWIRERSGIRYDPTTNIIHVATVAKDSSWWSTISPSTSNSIREIYSDKDARTRDNGVWDNFYRVNIHYNNLLEVLKELKNNPPNEISGENFGLNPEDWEVTLVGIQYELEEKGGKALLSGSFRGFSSFISQLPLY